MGPVDDAIVVLALVAAWSMGHHYSGAVVGTAFGSKSITLRKGLLVSGLLVILGAALSNVVQTYANLAKVGGEYSVVVLISFILMSNVTTFLKIPTSTIQLYTFGILGAALASGTAISYPTLAIIAVSWAIAPTLGFAMGRVTYRYIPQTEHLRYLIIGAMLYSALVLGLNDVSNAATSLVVSGVALVPAKLACGVAMMVGMVTWGSRLARRVGEDLVQLDLRKAAAAQLTKSIVISALNIFGVNASMNQTIVAALASMGARKKVLKSIVLGWIYSPVIGFAVSFGLSLLLARGLI
ncbi:MAG: anion permease [Thaumarchaeota archaeon]|nr:anion permease [Nitrososphaerota archaeon]